MEPEQRRTITEVITRYELEPEIRDLYVEGVNDKACFEWFFKRSECKSVVVFEIDCINIPEDLITKLQLQSNNRGRVIALSFEFERQLSSRLPYIWCIADTDFDFLFGTNHRSKYLLYTDYTSLDIYFFSKDILDKIFNLGLRRVGFNSSELLQNLVEVLKDVFCVRAANERLGWGLNWVDFTRSCKIHSGQIVFDDEDFIRRYLNTRGRLKDEEKFFKVYIQLKQTKLRTHRHSIRGGDYLELLAWYISKTIGKRGLNYRDPEVVRSLIFASADHKSLSSEKLFKKLLKIYKR